MNSVRIYTTKVCPYCQSAKELFRSLGVAFEEISLEGNPELRAQLSEENGGWRTVPMVFVGERFIGGYSDAKALHDKGELAGLLEA